MAAPVLQVDRLGLEVRAGAGFHPLVRELSFEVQAGETLAIVGESGCGKSLTALALMGLLPPRAVRAASGRILFGGHDLLRMPERALCDLRGNRMAMIFQEPMSSLNPVLTVGWQVAETVRVHRGVSHAEAWRAAIEALERVRLPDAARRAHQYPHQLSGGMRQRVMIAMALACRPALLIADEPTTALDVTIQAQILALIVELQKELGTGLILITHDLGVVAQTAQRVIVMYAGRKVEEASVDDLFADPRHPYTRGLMASMPAVISLGARTDVRLTEIPGMVPSLTNLPPGCAFAPRCPLAVERCQQEYPPLQDFGGHHRAACWRAAELAEAS